jgi:hypothetical protein
MTFLSYGTQFYHLSLADIADTVHYYAVQYRYVSMNIECTVAALSQKLLADGWAWQAL